MACYRMREAISLNMRVSSIKRIPASDGSSMRCRGKKGDIINHAGFTITELLITMTVFLLVLAGASQVLTGLMTQFKQQSKIAETNIEGVIGLEILRRDVEHAGYGLPWVIPTGVAYNEATAAEAAAFNDSPGNPPRAVLSGNNMIYSSQNDVFNGADYLVIKATNAATNAASQRWTSLRTANNKRTWGATPDDFVTTDRVIVISPGTDDSNRKTLVVSGGANWWTNYNDPDGSGPLTGTEAFAPDITETRFVYGIDANTNPRMPFNRADYYINREDTTVANDGVPDQCALGTGVLRKAIIAHADGDRTPWPLLDCTADMQAVYGIDTDTPIDGAVNCYVNNLANSLATVNAENIRNRVREVRVYILAHEGQYDRDFTYAINPVRVGEDLTRCAPGAADEAILGRNRDLSNINNWANYRWKVYTLVIKPVTLR